MRKLALLITGLSLSVQLFAQNDDSLFIRRIATEILVNGKAYDNLRELTKNIGARLTGSPNMVKAEKWGQEALRKSGADRVWLQQCMVPHWVRGGKDAATAFYLNAPSKGIAVTRVAKNLDVLALGNSLGTGQRSILADVLEVNSYDEL